LRASQRVFQSAIGNLQFEMFFISPMPDNARGPR
jgi:hypothetical protein